MTIFLIEPYTANTFVDNLEEPLLLEYAADSFKNAAKLKDYKILAIDMRVEGDMEVCLKSINCNGKVWVMCLANGSGNTETIQKVFCNIKALFPQAITVAAGHGILESPIVDVIIYDGNPGRVLAKLVEPVEQTDKKDFSGIDGISFFSDEGLQTTKPGSYTTLEYMPNRDITSHYRKHYTHCGKPAAWILDYQPYSSTPQKRKPEIIVKEIQKTEVEEIVFSDTKKISDAKWLKNLAAKLQSSGIEKKYHFTAAPTLILANPHLFSLWKSIGLTSVCLTSINDTPSKNAKNIKQAAALLNGIGLKNVITNKKSSI